MKFSFNPKTKETSLEANVEDIVSKSLEYKAKNPRPKTRYQIKQEEKRKNAELKHKQDLQRVLICCGILLLIIVICLMGAIMGS